MSPTQLNVQVPTDTATGPVPVQVTNLGGTTTTTATLANYSPGIFTFQGKYAAARHNADAVYVAPAGYFGTSTTSRPAQPGEIIQVYATGLGPTTPAVPAGQTVNTAAPLSDLNQLKVTVGGSAATIQYAGIVYPGEYQLNVVVPLLPDGDQLIVATIGGVTSQAGLSIPVRNAGTLPVSITLAPNGRTVRCGATLALTATVTNTFDQAVAWQVNGQTGGSAAVGTISAAGLYTAPAILPANPAITVTAISHFDPTVKTSITLNLQNPVPTVRSVTPATVNPGLVTITVEGAGFGAGAVVYFAGAAMTTTVVSDTRLTATGQVVMPMGPHRRSQSDQSESWNGDVHSHCRTRPRSQREDAVYRRGALSREGHLGRHPAKCCRPSDHGARRLARRAVRHASPARGPIRIATPKP